MYQPRPSLLSQSSYRFFFTFSGHRTHSDRRSLIYFLPSKVDTLSVFSTVLSPISRKAPTAANTVFFESFCAEKTLFLSISEGMLSCSISNPHAIILCLTGSIEWRLLCARVSLWLHFSFNRKVYLCHCFLRLQEPGPPDFWFCSDVWSNLVFWVILGSDG